MSNSQLSKDPIKDDILTGARTLFERFGFKKTTMEDIARQVGKSKSALYYYYKTKEEIFEAVVLEDIDKSRVEATAAMSNVESATDKFAALISTILGSLREKTDKFSIFRSDIYENPFLLENIVRQRDSYLEDLFKDILILGISRGEMRVMSNAEMDIWAKTTNLTFRSIGSKVFLDGNFTFLDHIPFLIDILLNGVSRQK
ncbi:MAG: TetR/AcrR family transcriptional regulator [Candidatus Pseudobacter hemicellulosilyticus]|uniref:TetR/AcrR family transcriptional regulator n=1 Tax=Candidatus Pseudobacter hemicellulosilyticus TaxID=3121375 RepID=A0AAJ5WWQ5_9BACT|nr:MAG: TetR/AcrR family transcriptional regulator [Pseudobacter sp.]